MSFGKIKHREVFQFVHRAIVNGEYAVGQRIPTEVELARRFEASRVTVARALRDLEQQGLLVRRRGAGSFVSRKPPEGKRLLGMISTDSPGLFTTITNVVARLAQEIGWGLLLGRHPAGNAEEILREIDQICEEYASRGVAGVFLVPMELPPELTHINARIADAFNRRGIAVVLLDRDVYDFPSRSRHDLVGIDNVNASYVLTEHLLDVGYRRIGFLRPKWDASTITARIAGYREALMDHGIEPTAAWISRGDNADIDFVREFMKRVRPEAIVCVNDHEAAKLMRSFAPIEVRVPEDVAIVGLDNDTWATLLSVSLTTLHQPGAELATAAMKLMLERLDRPTLPPREVCLTCKLIVRASSGAHLREAKGSKDARNPATPQHVY